MLDFLCRFDQSLKSHLHVVGQKTIFGQLMVGQLYLHMAIFLIHNAKKVSIRGEACNARPELHSLSSSLLRYFLCHSNPKTSVKLYVNCTKIWSENEGRPCIVLVMIVSYSTDPCHLLPSGGPHTSQHHLWGTAVPCLPLQAARKGQIVEGTWTLLAQAGLLQTVPGGSRPASHGWLRRREDQVPRQGEAAVQ